MKLSGIFVTLYNEETLSLYLDKGVYGFLMTPIKSGVSSRSKHYNALADYACLRKDTHIFFFLQRKIIYGGQIIGSADHASFLINGITSPLGKKCKAPLVWDESSRYEFTEEEGIFYIKTSGGKVKRSQPYLIQFEDQHGLKGMSISSDTLYFELGKYGFPLPSNSIQNMGFCTLTPGEVEILLRLLTEKGKIEKLPEIIKNIELTGTPMPFEPRIGIQDISQTYKTGLIVNEAHLEYSIIAYPNLLEEKIRPKLDDVICRQVPISPFKPYNMDRADICYFSSEEKNHSLIPNTVIELKRDRASNNAINQVIRYLDWLYLICEQDKAESIRAFVIAPSFTSTAKVNRYNHQIELISFT